MPILAWLCLAYIERSTMKNGLIIWSNIYQTFLISYRHDLVIWNIEWSYKISLVIRMIFHSSVQVLIFQKSLLLLDSGGGLPYLLHLVLCLCYIDVAGGKFLLISHLIQWVPLIYAKIYFLFCLGSLLFTKW